MFSNLASYIFGSSAEEPSLGEPSCPSLGSGPKSSEEEEWVVIGEAPGVLTLGSLNDVAPRPSVGSTGSSNPPSDPSSDSEDVADSEPAISGTVHDVEPEAREAVILTRTVRRLAVPFGAIAGPATMPEIRGVRAAQALKLKETNKQLSGKALNRRNKAVKHQSVAGAKKAHSGATVALKASGCMRNLKQC